MASIKISDLRPAGSELFQDHESFLDELNEREVKIVLGGKDKHADVSVISVYTESVGISLETFSVVTEVKKIKIKIK